LEEDVQLTDAITEHGANNWVAVEALVPARTSVQCRRRWIESLDPNLHRGRWIVQAGAKLTEAVAEVGNDWVRVAALFPGRTNNGCRHRWLDFLDPDINRGEWAVEEDVKLTDAITEHGANNWARVAVLFPGRTNNQCRHRWVKYLNPE
jgi:hypothetical protein